MSGEAAAEARPRSAGRRELLHRVESFLFWSLVLLAGRWCRVRVAVGEEHLANLRSAGGHHVLVFWHDRLFFASWFVSRQLIHRGFPLTVLVSPSRDGELAARTARRLGAEVVRGSSSRGAREGLRQLLRAASTGRGVAVVPDGPKGPARRAKPGAVAVARLAGAPLVPLTWVADRSWRLGSWDRLEIPKPFARVAVAVGAPRLVGRGGGDEAAARELVTLEESIAALDATAAASLAQGASRRERSKTR
ncbi:MAG TPA: lysophospholipid acyltransferase family protein [Thermoanaerobaculia bacterium]|nr:lysophospholipid acyltransferase family protein [Thermoanaerobaculia bacterium]